MARTFDMVIYFELHRMREISVLTKELITFLCTLIRGVSYSVVCLFVCWLVCWLVISLV